MKYEVGVKFTTSCPNPLPYKKKLPSENAALLDLNIKYFICIFLPVLMESYGNLRKRYKVLKTCPLSKFYVIKPLSELQ